MIIEKQIEKLNDWLKQGYIYEDAEGSGFYVNIKERIGGHEFYLYLINLEATSFLSNSTTTVISVFVQVMHLQNVK